MIFRQLFDTTSSTYTYLLADEQHGEALLIDPVFSQAGRDLALIRELGLKLALVVDTHAHADHVTAAWLLKQKTGCRIASAKAIGAEHVDLQLENGQTFSRAAPRSCTSPSPASCSRCRTPVWCTPAMITTAAPSAA